MMKATEFNAVHRMQALASEIGHGIGLGTNTGYDIPIVNRLWSFDHPQVFEEGMTLAVESREGEGSTFTLRLPTTPLPSPARAEAMAAARDSSPGVSAHQRGTSSAAISAAEARQHDRAHRRHGRRCGERQGEVALVDGARARREGRRHLALA